MLGKSHLLIGLTGGVVVDSIFHVSGPPLVGASHISFELVVNKGIYYFMVGVGALLPDIDNARSTYGRKLGWVSKEIQHVAGHRTIFHSLLGLVLGSVLAVGLQQLVIFLLAQRGLVVPALYIGESQLVLVAVLIGCILHIAADALTEGGVPLLWPSHKRYGFPPNPRWRFRTGDWPEPVIVFTFMLLVGIGIYYAVLTI